MSRSRKRFAALSVRVAPSAVAGPAVSAQRKDGTFPWFLMAKRIQHSVWSGSRGPEKNYGIARGRIHPAECALQAREQKIFRFFKRGDRCFARDGGKTRKELLEGFATFEVVKERLKRDPRATKNRSSSEDFRIFDYDIHAETVAYARQQDRCGNGRWRGEKRRNVPVVFDREEKA